VYCKRGEEVLLKKTEIQILKTDGRTGRENKEINNARRIPLF